MQDQMINHSHIGYTVKFIVEYCMWRISENIVCIMVSQISSQEIAKLEIKLSDKPPGSRKPFKCLKNMSNPSVIDLLYMGSHFYLH